MSKSPAFQLYAADFYMGTDDLTAAQVGGYIRLLCKQWDKNYLPFDKKILKKWTQLSSRDLDIVLEKFVKNENGYINERLEKERQKQEQYRISRSEAGKIGNKKRWGNLSHSDTDANTKVSQNNRSSSSVSNLQSSNTISKDIDTPTQKMDNTEMLKAEKEKAPQVALTPPELIRLNEWLKVNAPSILKMSEQMTIEQYHQLFKNYHNTEILAIFQSMHNYKPLLKNNKSVYLTAKNWMERDKKTSKPEGKQSGVSKNVENLLNYAERNP